LAYATLNNISSAF